MRTYLAVFICLVGIALKAQAPPQVLDDLMLASIPKPSTTAGYTAYATTFSGSAAYLEQHTTIYMTNSTKCTFSAWFRIDANPSAQTWLFTWRNSGGIVSRTSGTLRLTARGTITNPAYQWIGNTTITNGDGWHHFWVSFDGTSTNTRSVYLDGAAADGSWAVYTVGESIVFNNETLSVGGSPIGGSLLQGCMAEVWFDSQYSTDVTKWISGGKPVNLGTDGSTPTGFKPGVYLRDPYGSFTNNYGYGLNFTQVGTLTSCTAP